MKRIFAVAALMLFVGIAFTATVSAGDKVWICHFDNSSDDAGHTKFVNVNAVDSHIGNHELDFYLVDYTGEEGESCAVLE